MSAERCGDCHAPLLASKAWRRMSPSERRQCGHKQHVARGLCACCYARRSVAGTLIDVELSTLPRELMLEEWGRYAYDYARSHKDNVRIFARELGRPFASVEKALLRAGINVNRRRGEAA